MPHFTNLKRTFFSFLGCLLLLTSSFVAQGQVTLTPATASSNACIGGNYVSLTNITIAESALGLQDIGNSTLAGSASFTISLVDAANFQFNTSVGSVSAFPGSDDVSAISLSYPSATEVKIDFSFDNTPGTDFQDVIVISGLQVKAISGTATATDLVLSALTENVPTVPDINGLALGAIFGTVTSVDAPTAFAGTDVKVCYGSNYSFAGATSSNGTILWTHNGAGSLDDATIINPVYTSGGPGTETGNITFTLTVTGGGNCGTAVDSRVLTISPALGLTEVLGSHVNVTCFGGTGSLTVGATGGGGTYEYSKDGTTWQASPTFPGLVAGPYSIQVRDAAAITCVYTGLAPITISTPLALGLTEASHTNVVCNGAATGDIVVGPSGGSGSYEYSKDGGASWQSSAAFFGLVAGPYSIRVRDALAPSCVYAGLAPITVTQPPALGLSEVVGSHVNVTCNGASTGVLVVSATGGSGFYSYSKDLGTSWQPSATFNTLAAGNYTIWVRDFLTPTCIYSGLPPITITQQPALGLTEVVSSHVNVNCFGGANGSLTVFPSGGGGGYEYSKDGSTWQSSPTFGGLAAGSYSIQVRDAVTITCVYAGLGPITITAPPVLTLSETSHANISCFGATTGSIVVNPGGGSGSYEFSKDGGLSWQPSAAFGGLTAGPYSIRVRDAAAPACVYSGLAPITITQPPALGLAEVLVSHVNVNCNGASTGVIVVSPSGGSGTYEYSKDLGTSWQSSATFSTLAAGNYPIWVRDFFTPTCVYTGLPAITISQPPALGLTEVVSSHVNVNCFGGATGSLTVSATGGAGTYEYSKDGITWLGSPVFSGLIAGSYTIRVRDAAATGCVFTAAPIVISEPAVLTLLLASQTNILCFGASTGVITVTPGGGSTAYEFSKDAGTSWQTSATFNGLVAGVYSIRVRDAAAPACVYSGLAPITITQPPALGLTEVLVSHVNVNCNGASTGVIVVSGSGGAGTYEYSKDGGTSWQPGGTFNTLAAGSYNIWVRDAVTPTCVYTGLPPIVITQPPALGLTEVVSSHVNVNCFGGATGSLTVSATGGAGTYEYSKDGITWLGSPVFSGLIAGSYTIRVRDAAATGCVFTIATPIVISEPAVLTLLLASQTNILCFGASTGVITVTPGGGSTAYEFSRDAGTSWQTSATFNGLVAGVYSIRVRDAAAPACVYSGLAPITITQPPALGLTEVLVSHVNVNCNGASTGVIVVSASGGAGTYEYSKDGGTSWQSSATFNTLAAGSYNIWVRDQVTPTCVYTGLPAITISQPPALGLTEVVSSHVNVNCFGGATGSLTVSATGGAGTYEYSKDAGVSWQSSATFSGLVAGSYSIRVRDAVAITCVYTGLGAITITTPAVLTLAEVVPSHVNVVCNGASTGVIVVSATGGAGTYEYSRDAGLTWQPSATFNGLVAGVYSIRVRDAAAPACVYSGLAPITITQPPALGLTEVLISHVNVNCNGASTGVIVVSASGGAGTYEYSKDGGTSWQSSATFNTLAAGSYNIWVRDQATPTCVYTGLPAITISQPPALGLTEVVSSHVNVNCFGGATGSLTVSATGGAGTYEYSKDAGVSWQSSATFSGLVAGSYSIRVRDAVAITCVYTGLGAITITTPAVLNLTEVVPSHVNVQCNGASTGVIVVSATGGAGTYEYSRDAGLTWQPSATFSGLAAGVYSIRVRDAAAPACVYSGLGPITITTVNPSPIFAVNNAQPIICEGAPSSTNIILSSSTPGQRVRIANIIATGGVTGFSAMGTQYNAFPVTISDVMNNPTSTAQTVTYQFEGSIGGACVDPVLQTITVIVNPLPDVVTTPASQNICSGTATAIALTTSNGVASTTYSWTVIQSNVTGATNGFGPNINQNLTATTSSNGTATYTITPTAAGCNGSPATVIITVRPSPNVVATPAAQAICTGTATNIALTTTNGVASPTYTWTRVDAGVTGTLVGSGATISETLSTTGSVPGTATYTITPAAAGCNGVSVTVIVTVNPRPNVVTTPPSQTLCSGVTTGIALSTSNGVASPTYSWTVLQTNVSGATAGFGTSINQTLTTTTSANGTATYTVTPTASGCSGTPATVIITMKPLPNVVATPAAQSICSGTATNIALSTTNGVASPTYTWTRVDVGVTGTLVGSGATIAETLTATGAVSGTATYTITPAAAGCNGVTLNYTVTVFPTPTANGANITICSGQNASITINAGPQNVLGTTFDWTVSPSGNVTGASNGNGSFINQLLTLTNSTVGTVVYHVTPSANGCSGLVKDITVTINPVAVVDAGIDYQVCEPITIPLSGTIGGAATSGTWVVVTGAGSVSGSTTTVNVVTATYTVNPADITTTIVLRLQTNDPDGPGPCTLASDLLNIQINRKPTVVAPADYTVCEPVFFSSTPIMLTGTIGGSATTGLWSVITGAGGLSATNVSGSTVTSNYVIAASDVGTTLTFRLTTNDPDGLGPCVPLFDDINIHINPRAVVSAGPDLALCSNIPSKALQGSFSGSTVSVLWTGGAGGYSNSASPTSTYSFIPAEVNTTITLTLTAADPDGTGPTGPCTAVADQMLLTINPLPVVVFSGLPPVMAENNLPVTLTGNQIGGLFTILPVTSNIGSTTQSPVDKATFDPSAVTLGPNSITYTFTNSNGCTNTDVQSVIVNPVTTVLYGIQNATFNTGALQWELCADQGNLLLTGNPPASSGGAPETKFTASVGQVNPSNVMTLIFDGTNYFIQTNTLISDTYLVRYTYKNSFGAISFIEYPVKVYASPTALISNLANNCISSAINFNDGSTIPATPYPTSLSTWRWDFDDGSSASVQNPSHMYTTSGLYDVGLRVTTFQGCSGTTSLPIRVGDVPLVDFGWSAICTNDLTKYLDQTNPGSISTIVTYTWDFGDGDVLTGPNGGSVPGGTHGGRTTGTFKDPQHNFTTPGTYSSKLTVDTDDLCNNSKTQSVFILPAGTTVTPNAASPYFKDFEANNAGWIPEGLKISPPLAPPVFSPLSWVYGSPSGITINTASSGTKAWWTGANANSYYLSEQSAVNGPCFDLTQLTRPMISLDFWADAEKNLDGAALQYSTDGGINWNIVGPPTVSPDEGVNWYNGQIVQSNPGQQPFGSNGWTGKVGSWNNARFHLDMIPIASRSQVRIRVAFSSNGSNDPSLAFDGFGFDNVFVGDKKRNVLVEHFTNSTLQASVDGDTWIDNLYQDQITFRGISDFHDIQYHISFPNPDALNKDNPGDPAARSLFFGVSQPPASIMDGVVDGVKFKGKYTDLTRVEIDRRALKDPLFDLQLANVATATPDLISVKLTITALKAFNSPLIVQVALLENQVGTFKNVLRQQLFGADGETITLPFNANDVLFKTKDNVKIMVPLVTPSQTTLVGYIQDKNTKEILQSVVIPILAPFKQGATIVGLGEPDPIPTTLNGISVYPNPANGSFYFGLPDNRTTQGFEWKLIDQRGITLKSGDFEESINNTKQVDVRDFANGIYFVMLSGPGKSVVYKKIIIMNRN